MLPVYEPLDVTQVTRLPLHAPNMRRGQEGAVQAAPPERDCVRQSRWPIIVLVYSGPSPTCSPAYHWPAPGAWPSGGLRGAGRGGAICKEDVKDEPCTPWQSHGFEQVDLGCPSPLPCSKPVPRCAHRARCWLCPPPSHFEMRCPCTLVGSTPSRCHSGSVGHTSMENGHTPAHAQRERRGREGFVAFVLRVVMCLSALELLVKQASNRKCNSSNARDVKPRPMQQQGTLSTQCNKPLVEAWYVALPNFP